jgi:hypothetical protein
MLFPLLLLATSIQPALPDVPYRQPQLTAAHGVVAMTFGGGSSIYFAASKDQGVTFSAPVKVADTGALALGRHRGPRATILKDSILVTAVVAEKVATSAHAHGLPENGNLLVWRSRDQGRTFQKISVVNDAPGATREGLHAIAVAPDGSLFAVWLDQRTTGMKLYGARSKDGGVTWAKNVEVYGSPDGSICSCCHPSLTIEASGRVWVMWRNVLDGYRDLYVTYSDDGVHFQPAVKQGVGAWKLNACPMDGGGFVVENGKVTSAWRRESDIYLAEPGGAEKLLGPGKDVALVKTGRGAYVAWTSKEGGIVARTPKAAETQVIAPAGGFVSLAALPGGAVLAAWESQGAIHTKRIE